MQRATCKHIPWNNQKNNFPGCMAEPESTHAYTISQTAAAVELGNFPRPHIRMRLNENSISIDLTPTKTKKKLGEMRSIRSVNHSSQAACARALACRRGTAAGSKMRTRCMDHHLSPRGRESERPRQPSERASPYRSVCHPRSRCAIGPRLL